MSADDRIDFVSAYCDRWCERCPFTSRCSQYAVNAAVAMCDGDFEAALQLAVGPPADEDPAITRGREEFMAKLADFEPSQADEEAWDPENAAREERIDDSRITTGADKVSLLAFRWFDEHREALLGAAPAPLRDAIEVVDWDKSLIGAKLHRALSGRDEYLTGEPGERDPVQNDWNGSAKVALISIERSTRAWALIADATADPEASLIAEELTRLRAEVERTFPDAWQFVRPGFDQPGR